MVADHGSEKNLFTRNFMPNKSLKDNVTKIGTVLNCGSHGRP
jgi:hypothetical protein